MEAAAVPNHHPVWRYVFRTLQREIGSKKKCKIKNK
jgi:hypothetical protein